jgi:hypothetical protein
MKFDDAFWHEALQFAYHSLQFGCTDCPPDSFEGNRVLRTVGVSTPRPSDVRTALPVISDATIQGKA